jgi:hypothetical protein
LKNLKRLAEGVTLNEIICEEINISCAYYHFMCQFLEFQKKIFDKYFETYLRSSLDVYEIGFKFVWILFSYFKKTILKRKSDYHECGVLMSVILEIVREELKTMIKVELTHYDFNKEYKNYFKNLPTPTHNYKLLENSHLRELVLKSFSEFRLEESSTKIIQKKEILENNYKIIEQKYKNILTTEEIDDRFIFSSFFYEKIFERKSMSNSSTPIRSSQLFNDTNKNFDVFFNEALDYTFLDISYLQLKFTYSDIENKKIDYSSLFKEFETSFLQEYMKKSSRDLVKLDFVFYNHKNLFLKLIDELMLHEKEKYRNGFNLILNDEQFYQSFLIISVYLYFSLLYAEKPLTLEDVSFEYCINLNKYENFDFLNVCKILMNLVKIEVPSALKTILKKFQHFSFTVTLWQSNSFLIDMYKRNPFEDSEEAKKIYVNNLLIFSIL